MILEGVSDFLEVDVSEDVLETKMWGLPRGGGTGP